MTLLLILGMSFITFINRYAFFIQAFIYEPGDNAKRFLSYSTYAILTAIWAPIIFSFQPEKGVSIAGWDYLIAASAAALMSLIRIHSLFVVIISVGIFFLLRFYPT